MTANDHELLGQFTREQSQDAFTELVRRHVNLVYSAALRQVRSPELADEVSQSVFAQLARAAGNLKSNTVLSAWLYQVTHNAAVDTVRREARRQAREQIAFQMSDMNDPSGEWTRIEPLLDEAMQALDATDRTAILLRYFENKSLREVGQAIGASEDAAQKRVSRALERLREFFSKRKVAVGACGIAALLSANAVQGAPSGLAATLASGAIVASTTLSTSTVLAVAKTVAMTTIQKTIITAVAAGAVVFGVFQAREISNLHTQVRTLEQQQTGQAALSNLVQDLQRERDRATNALAVVSAENAALKKNPTEVLKLRGEVGRLQHEKAAITSSSALSKVTSNPEARKMLRDQQKLGMSVIFKGFAQRMKLDSEQTEKLNDLLADHIMADVDHVTTILRDKLDSGQMDALFASEEAAVEDKVRTLLGQDGLDQFKDYNKNILGSLSAEQFKSMMTGTDDEKEQKSKQLAQAIQAAAQGALTDAGLPADYQTVPILNFRNIASEQDGEQSLKLLEDIYQRAAAHSGAFLTPEDLKKFDEFRNIAINNSRMALSLNRTMMAPISN